MCYRSHSTDSAVDASITFQLSVYRKSLPRIYAALLLLLLCDSSCLKKLFHFSQVKWSGLVCGRIELQLSFLGDGGIRTKIIQSFRLRRESRYMAQIKEKANDGELRLWWWWWLAGIDFFLFGSILRNFSFILAARLRHELVVELSTVTKNDNFSSFTAVDNEFMFSVTSQSHSNEELCWLMRDIENN